MEISELPGDPAMLLSFVNMKLRDDYASANNDKTGLDLMCDDLDIDKTQLTQRLAEAGFEYSPQQNRFW